MPGAAPSPAHSSACCLPAVAAQRAGGDARSAGHSEQPCCTKTRQTGARVSVLGLKINLLRAEGVGSRLPPLQPWGRDGQGMLGGKAQLLFPARLQGGRCSTPGPCLATVPGSSAGDSLRVVGF